MTYTITSPFRKLVVTSQPEHIRHILQGNNKNYRKSFAYDILRLLLGNGLLTSEGDFWRRQRRLAQPAFHRERLNNIAQIISEKSQKMLDKWAVDAKQHKWVNLSQAVNNLALDIVSEALFYSDIQQYDLQEISRNVTIMIEFGDYRIMRPWALPLWFPSPRNLKFKRAKKKLDALMYEMIDNRRGSQVQRNDLLQMLLEAKDEETGEGMSNEQLRDEVITLFMAGHETTANALIWTFYLLGANPSKAEKIRTELSEVLKGEAPNFDNVRALVYLRQVIDESMRLYPPAWIVGRKTIGADQWGGYEFPAGVNVVMPILVMHRDPDIWENAEQFEPERFEPERFKEQHKQAYLPFGAGPRLCIGNNFALIEMQIVLALSLQRFDYELSPDFKPDMQPLVTLRPKHDLKIKLKER